jgi:hypothetical protein
MITLKKMSLNMLLFMGTIQGMDTELPTISIVDQNEQQSLAHVIEPASIVSIFGATPRYSQYERYMMLLKNNFIALKADFEKSKRLKGTDKLVKQCIYDINTHCGFGAVVQLFSAEAEGARMRLFLENGIDQKVLQQNMKKLLNTAHALQEGNTSSVHLVHVLLPSYFADLAHLKHQQNTPDALHSFLRESALFYQKMYGRVGPAYPLKITIFIPCIEHFVAILNQANTDVQQTNLGVLQTDIFDQIKSPKKMVLINQNMPDLERMITQLRQSRSEPFEGIGLPITNSMGHQSTIFNPYLLKPEKEYPYKTSPIFNHDLFLYIKHMHKGNS